MQTKKSPKADAPTAVKQKSLAKLKLLLDLAQLEHRCKADTSTLLELFGPTHAGGYAYKDNGSDVLAVAHCDYVELPYCFDSVKLAKETLVFSPRLDDRLGVYTVLDMLPAMGIVTDVLLTDGEEIGQSTAENFIQKKRYNWVVEFDRKGTDVVTYQYRDFDDIVGKFFSLGWGSFSDIATLDNLGCQCCNVGVGYYNEHTDRCHMVVDDYLKQLVRFRRMWTAHHKTHYPYSKIEERNWSGQLTTRDDVYECPHCLCQFFDWETVITETHILCPDCGLKAALAF